MARKYGSKKHSRHSKKTAKRASRHHRRRTHRRGGKASSVGLAKGLLARAAPVLKAATVPGSLLLLNTLFKGKKRNGSRRTRRGRRSSRR